MEDNKIRQIVQDELRRSNNGGRFGLNTIPFHTHDGINSQKVKQENIIPSVSVSGNISFAREDTYTIYLNSSFTPSHIQLYGIAYSVSGTVTFNATSPETVTTGTVYEVDGQRFTILVPGISTSSIVTSAAANPPPSSGILDKVGGTGSGSGLINYSSIVDGSTLGARCQIIGSANLGPSFYLQPGSSSSVVTGNLQYPFIDPVLGVAVPLQSSSYIWTQSANIFKALSGEGHIVNVQAGGVIYARATITEFSRDQIVIVVSNLEPTWTISANLIIT